MAKLKKNYSINSAAVELLDELADRLHMYPGEIIADLVALFGVKYFETVMLNRSNLGNVMAELQNLQECVLYELAGEEQFKSLEEGGSAEGNA